MSTATSPKKTSDAKIACLQFLQKKNQRLCVFTGRPLTDKGKQVEADIWWAFFLLVFLVLINFTSLIIFVLVNCVFFFAEKKMGRRLFV